jgi:hypothetical protein
MTIDRSEAASSRDAPRFVCSEEAAIQQGVNNIAKKNKVRITSDMRGAFA